MALVAFSVAIALGAVLASILLLAGRTERAGFPDPLEMTDPATGAKTRRYVQQTIDKDVAIVLRRLPYVGNRTGGAPRDVDLTFFSIVCDRVELLDSADGNARGDVLAGVACALRRACRDSDVVVRWRDDEFLVLARFVDRADAAGTAERLRHAVASEWTTLPSIQPSRSFCSVGFASYPFDLRDPEARAWTDVCALAELAMRAAKMDGHDRCVGFVPGSAVLPCNEVVIDSDDVDRLQRDGFLARIDQPRHQPRPAANPDFPNDRSEAQRGERYSYSPPSFSAASSTKNAASSSATASV